MFIDKKLNLHWLHKSYEIVRNMDYIINLLISYKYMCVCKDYWFNMLSVIQLSLITIQCVLKCMVSYFGYTTFFV